MSEPVQQPTVAPDPQNEPTPQPQSPPPIPYKVFKPTDSVTKLLPPLPDEYFELTAADIRNAQASLTARAHALVDAPIQLKATRDAAEQAKRDRWPLTRIRVRFPDRTQLERVFPSTDKIKSVYAFVRELLRDDVKAIKFVLYQSPPKREFKVSDVKVKGLSLSELQLAPASVLLLRFEDDSLNHVNVTAPLLPEVLAQAVNLPIPTVAESAQPTIQSPSTVSKLLSSGEKKIPKWFKMGKK